MDIEKLRRAVIDKRFILSANPDWRKGRFCGLTDDETEKKANDALSVILDSIEELVVAYLIDARQSVKSEDNWKELREEFMHNLRGCDTVTVSLSGIGSTNYSTEDIHNMISALTDNQPVAKLATSEEVQEAIEYFEDTLQFISGEPQEKDHKLAITALQAYQPKEPCSECIKYQNDFNYCADCGRKLGD